MESQKLSSGSKVFDTLLEGGIEQDIITTLYGPAGVGKTCFCMLASIAAVKAGKKVIYIDTEGGFSMERFKQLCPDYNKILEHMVFFKPSTFQQQKDIFTRLNQTVNSRIGLIVVDTISMLYRLEAGLTKDIVNLNKDLGQQVNALGDISRKRNVPIIITNQVYADFLNKDKTSIVGGDILKYASKCMIELQAFAKGNRKAAIKKHRSIAEAKEALFKIVDIGFEAV